MSRHPVEPDPAYNARPPQSHPEPLQSIPRTRTARTRPGQNQTGPRQVDRAVSIMMSKTIFVTGGSGLVGSHAVEEALRRGHHVKTLVRPTSDTRWLDQHGVEKIVGDLEDDDSLRRGVQDADWVFNCAAKVGDWGTLEEFRRLNVEALRRLLDAALEAKVSRFVHVSSLGVYEGRDHYGTDETTPPAASSLDAYTRSKTEAEALALSYVPRGLPVAVVRPGFIYGERDRTVLPKLLTNLRRGTFAYFGSGNQALNCIYVKNLVHAVFLAAEVPGAVGEVFNLTDGQPVSKRQFIGRVAELAGLRPPRRRIPLWLARFLADRMEARARRRGATEPPLVNKARYKFLGLNLDYSIEKARRVLGYNPPFTTEQGLAAAMADLCPDAVPAQKTPSTTRVS
jgi:nucleoside-diphosphate-sugar epimerase